jgi:hypothetical protein
MLKIGGSPTSEQTPVRNESECGLATEVGLALSCGDAPSTDHDPLVKDLSMSIYVGWSYKF